MQVSFRQGVLMIIVAAVLWGTSGVCGQYLFEQYPTDASWMITVRQLAAGALFLGWLVFKKKHILAIWGVGGRDIKRGDDARGNARNRFDLLFFTYGGLLGAQYGFYYTISLANAPTATILQYTAPIFLVLWSAYKHRTWPDGREMTAVFLAMLGVFLISTHGRLDTVVISREALFWGLLSAVALAIYTIVPVQLLQKYSTTLVMGWGQLLSGLFLSIFFNPLVWGTGRSLEAAACIAYIVIIGTIIPFSLFLLGVKVVGPTKSSIISCAEPLSSIVFMVLLLGHHLAPLDMIGMLCIIVTVLLLARGKK